MWWADEIGLANVHAAILRYRDIVGADYWTPSPLLERLAAIGGRFYEPGAAVNMPVATDTPGAAQTAAS